MAVMSAQRIGSASFYVGGMTALELHGLGHFARLDSERQVHLYDPEGVVPAWLRKLTTAATIMLHTRALFTDPSLGVEWHSLDLGPTRLGVAVSSERKRVVSGTSVSGRVGPGDRRIIKKQHT